LIEIIERREAARRDGANARTSACERLRQFTARSLLRAVAFASSMQAPANRLLTREVHWRAQWPKRASRKLPLAAKKQLLGTPRRSAGSALTGQVREEKRSRLRLKLQDYRNDYYTFSGKASDLSRQLSFAAIALIWLFKKDDAGQLTIPADLIVPGVLVVSSLTLDMLQYCFASIIWYCFYRSKENANVSEDAELDHSVWLERPTTLLFVAKIICVIVAYGYILVFFVKLLKFA
jgi:hypothetical protein